MKVIELPLGEVCLDQRAQPRVEIDQGVINEYAQEMHGGATFPPITVFHDGARYWLADGFHRYHAHQQAGANNTEAEVHEGSLKDAILYSVSANATHGLRRSNNDKRRAVRTLLEDEEWQKWSENEIGKRCGVSRTLVTDVRKELETKGDLAEKQDGTVTFRRRGKSHAMKVENIGRKAEEHSSTPDPSGMSQRPATRDPDAEALKSLRTLYASFSTLPKPEAMASLIKEHQADFSGLQASEVGVWFQDLAYLLDGCVGYSRWNTGPRRSARSLHEPAPTEQVHE